MTKMQMMFYCHFMTICLQLLGKTKAHGSCGKIKIGIFSLIRTMNFRDIQVYNTETVTRRYSVKKSPQACSFSKKEALAQVFSCVFCEISKNIYSYRTPLVAVSQFLLLAPFMPFSFFNFNTVKIKAIIFIP